VRVHLRIAAFGLALGVVLSASGLSDWGEVHRMFTLGVGRGGPGWGELRLLLAFGGAVVLSIAGFGFFARDDDLPEHPVRAGTIPGAILFGAGWALTGACPAAALVQLGEGKGAAALTLVGMLAGSWLHELLRRRLGWARLGCGE
jgi:uncharacterized membrane protein YedE/YeeE